MSFDITLEASNEFELAALNKISSEINQSLNKLNDFFKITAYKVYTLKNIVPEEVLHLLQQLGGELYYYKTIVYIDKRYGIVTGSIHRNSGYINLRLRFISKDTQSLKLFKESITQLFNKYLIKQEDRVIPIQWYFSKDSGDIDYHIITDVFNESILQEAYPFLPNIFEYIDAFIREQEANILVLLGPPGTGKTRLIRYLIQKIDEYKRYIYNTQVNLEEDDDGSPIYVLYTTDTKVLRKEEIFIEFLSEDNTVLVLEDIDLYLKDRKTNHNEVMHKFLASSSGFIQNKGRKIIISTNLPVQDIDDALLRPGRSFGKVQTRYLTLSETESFFHAMECNISMNKLSERKDFALSELYQLITRFKK